MSPQNGMYPQNGTGGYPQTGASLYPAPIPGIPHQVGGTAIMNQAFHPHEYLYPHRYEPCIHRTTTKSTVAGS